MFDERPDVARKALQTIEATGRDALAELRRLLQTMRPDEPENGEDGHAPQPGLDHLDTLASTVQAAGLEVVVQREGAAVALPAGVDLSAYRIVQEALTNTLRHAHATRAEVTVRYAADAVAIEVTDDGGGGAPDPEAGGGHGLVGMRERAALVGGTIEIGAAPQGGFRIRAELPLGIAGMSTIRVLLADDQALVREGFRHIIDAREDLEVVGEADDGREAIALAERTHPHVILMDVRMPNLDGIEATRRLVASGHPARIVILTTFDLDEAVFGALRAGASGFMLKDIRAAELVVGDPARGPRRGAARPDRHPAPARPLRRRAPRRAAALDGRAHAARGRGPAPRRAGADERRDRRAPHAHRGDGEVARLGDPAQARPARPRPGGRRRLRRGPGAPAHGLSYSGRSDAIAPMTFCSHGRSGDSRASWRMRRVANCVMSRRLPTTISGPVSA